MILVVEENPEGGMGMNKINTINFDFISRILYILDTKDFIEISEIKYDNQIRSIVSESICNKVRVVRIAGPSGSGKTTTAQRVVDEFISRGIPAHCISMDNWYKTMGVCDTPLTDDGELDFESPELLDIHGFKEDIRNLIAGKTIHLREFDFVNRISTEATETLTLEPNGVLVVEGLHAINPMFDVPELDYRVYVEPSSVKFEDGTLLSSKELRMFRRIHRDQADRGMTLEATVAKCKSVDKGQDRYITPYINNPEIFKVDTLIYYELYIHKNSLSGLLDSRILDLIPNKDITDSDILDRSILREFYKKQQ